MTHPQGKYEINYSYPTWDILLAHEALIFEICWRKWPSPALEAIGSPTLYGQEKKMTGFIYSQLPFLRYTRCHILSYSDSNDYDLNKHRQGSSTHSRYKQKWTKGTRSYHLLEDINKAMKDYGQFFIMALLMSSLMSRSATVIVHLVSLTI